MVIMGLTILTMVVSNVIFPVAWRTIVLIIGMLIVVFSIYLKGGKDERLTWELEKSQMETKIKARETERAKISTELAVLAAKNRELILKKGTIQNVETYISSSDNAGCVVPSGFVRLHNDSARGLVSNPTR
jgi:hypothetical protein